MDFDYSRLRIFIKKHCICFGFAVLGLLAGPFGFFAGICAGVFVELIIYRLKEEKKYRRIFENGKIIKDGAEPFTGAIFTCALCVYSCGNAQEASHEAKLIFGKKYKADWDTICRSAEESAGLNGDLLVEYLAATLLKAIKEGEIIPFAEIFNLLQISEFGWDYKEKGEKPSIYLAQLLNYKYDKDDLATAYEILGLKKNAELNEVKKAHRKLASKFHPDSGKYPDEAQFIKVQKAYEKIIQSKI